MTYPDARTMESLGAILHAEAGHTTDLGELWAIVQGGRWLILPAELDELERRGWVEAFELDGDTDRLQATGAGRYWWGKWQERTRTRGG